MSVVIIAAIDREIHDMSAYIGKVGHAIRLDPTGPGASLADPMVIVEVDGNVDAFWREELASA